MVGIIEAEVDVILHRSQKIPACHSIAWLDACLQQHAEAHLEGCGELPIFRSLPARAAWRTSRARMAGMN